MEERGKEGEKISPPREREREIYTRRKRILSHKREEGRRREEKEREEDGDRRWKVDAAKGNRNFPPAHT